MYYTTPHQVCKALLVEADTCVAFINMITFVYCIFYPPFNDCVFFILMMIDIETETCSFLIQNVVILDYLM